MTWCPSGGLWSWEGTIHLSPCTHSLSHHCGEQFSAICGQSPGAGFYGGELRQSPRVWLHVCCLVGQSSSTALWAGGLLEKDVHGEALTWGLCDKLLREVSEVVCNEGLAGMFAPSWVPYHLQSLDRNSHPYPPQQQKKKQTKTKELCKAGWVYTQAHFSVDSQALPRFHMLPDSFPRCCPTLVFSKLA